MDGLNNVKVGQKLIGGFLFIALILALFATYNYFQVDNLGKQQDIGHTLAKDALDAKDIFSDTLYLYQVVANAELNLNFQQTQIDWTSAKQQTEKDISNLTLNAETVEEKAWIKDINERYANVVSLFENKMLPALKTAKSSTPETLQMDSEMDGLILAMQKPVQQYVTSLEAENVRLDETFDESKRTIETTTIIVAIVCFIIALFLGITLSGSITGPLTKGVNMMQELGKGHLTQRLKMKRRDEIGILANAMDLFADDLQNNVIGTMKMIAVGDLSSQISSKDDQDEISPALNNTILALQEMAKAAEQIANGDLTAEISPRSKQDVLGNAFSKMINNLNNTLQQTSSVTDQVVQAVEQVRSVSQDLSSNAQEQSAAVEEVASSVEETDSQVKASADHAGVANQLASQTTSLASVGQEKMKALSQSMNSIAHSSQEISKIIKVIDEIAFQTNLLALNAAVEAARAGQYGKGFAVVAQEVRNLAERSAKAAKSTAELIEDSSRRVQEGVNMTDETAHSLNDIVQNIIKVKDLVGEIAAASEEQTKALNQISGAITQVSQGTQSNSSQSEELASTADELGGLAERLREEVEKFKLRQKNGEVWAGLPAGMTPEMLQAALTAMQNSDKKQKSKTGGKNSMISVVDRDERGYGHF